MLESKKRRIRRHRKVRKRIQGSSKVPRLCIFKSAKHIYAQLIDDEKGKVIVAAKDQELKKLKERETKVNTAKEVGKLIAAKSKDLKIEKVVFDRGGFKYHGRIRAIAEGAREGGLKF